jgi:RHS repeat-associated protein
MNTKFIYTFLMLFVVSVFFGQEAIPVADANKNSSSTISYNLAGETISKNVSYFNTLGKGTQQQSWDILTNRVWASEVRYDGFGRAALETLSAPVANTSNFGYKLNFLQSNNLPITLGQYDNISNQNNPPPISPNINSLGWYYSSLNTLDTYQDVTNYPYTRYLFSELNPGATKAIIGGNKINNAWKQAYSFSMPIETLVPISSQLDFNPLVGTKTVSRDIHGTETVVFYDTDGNMTATARSGGPDKRMVTCKILENGFTDIHIPDLCGGNIMIQHVNNNIRIFDLISENIVATNVGTSIFLAPGFYRIEDVNNVYGSNTALNPIIIKYETNYYDYSRNIYDEAGRLIQTTQPIGITDTFDYDSFGQLLSSKTGEEGASDFKYRRDGQIRFSQNSEQVLTNSFSYTNYDNLARPVESGVYTGTELVFRNPTNITNLNIVDNIVDNLDGLPTTGKNEQNFTVYDLPDTSLQQKLTSCNILAADYKQSFLAGNVSYTYTKNPDTSKTWYSYDVFGRVTWVVQEINGLGCLKTIHYEYNPINGQVIKVIYQKNNAAETFIHKYDYNKAGQLVTVYTSTNELSYEKQAEYKYNESGALIRTELASNLQGIDYVYNLNGQLKAINHPSLSATNDPGNDGANGFAADVFGISLDYYDGDYTRSNAPKPIITSAQGTNQYNGNIKATRWNTQVPSATQNAYTYQYNKNNWITNATFGTANQTGLITPNTNNDYAESNITYDANGNIKTLTRNGYTDANGTNSMDNLYYSYGKRTNTIVTGPYGIQIPYVIPSNRLLNVYDSADNPVATRYNDIKNQNLEVQLPALPATGYGINIPQYTSLDNYVYNDLGQLKINFQDKVGYDYNAAGLVTQISILNPAPGNYYNSSFKTISYQQYSQFLGDNDGWHTTDPNSILDTNTYVNQTASIYTANTICNDIPAISSYNDGAISFATNKKVQKNFRVIPNATFKLSFNLLISKKGEQSSPGPNVEEYVTTTNTYYDQNGQPYTLDETTTVMVPGPPILTPIEINPTVVVKFKRPDGTVFHTQTITSTQPAQYCNQFIQADVSHEFTNTDDNYFTLEVETIANVGTNGDITAYGALLDNLKLEVNTAVKVAFDYNERGHRIKKTSYGDFYFSATTYYVRDISGNTLAVYNSNNTRTGALRQVENTIYGASRIGVFKRGITSPIKGSPGTKSQTLYELTDHLGNVRAVISKMGEAIVSLTNKTDYYPFGMPLPNKQITDGNYRYNFQGQEKDPETGMEAFELRLWDGRLGRWLSVDPMHEFDSPYIGMGNNPINVIDPDGGSTIDPIDPPKTDAKPIAEVYISKTVKSKSFSDDNMLRRLANDNMLKRLADDNMLKRARDIISNWADENLRMSPETRERLTAHNEAMRGILSEQLTPVFSVYVQLRQFGSSSVPLVGAFRKVVSLENAVDLGAIGYKAIAAQAHTVNNIEKLKYMTSNVASGRWVKVYEAAIINGKQYEVHYFRHVKTGITFESKIKYPNGGWSKQFTHGKYKINQ